MNKQIFPKYHSSVFFVSDVEKSKKFFTDFKVNANLFQQMINTFTNLENLQINIIKNQIFQIISIISNADKLKNIWLGDYFKTFGLKVIIIRYAITPFGAGV